MSNRIIARVSKENEVGAVLERAKQRFTTLESLQDLGKLKTVFLDFASKDDNFITILKSDEFPEVVSAIWDRDILYGTDDATNLTEQFTQDVGTFDGSYTGGAISPVTTSRDDLVNHVATPQDTTSALAQQVSPNSYGNILPYTVGAGTPYSITATITNTTHGPKYYVNGSLQNPQMTHILPGHVLTIDVSDASNFGQTLSFSTTPDGTHQGGVAYEAGLVRTGTPGVAGAVVELTISQTTPKEVYIYSAETAKTGIYAGEFIAPTVSFRFTVFSKWYLGRVTQQTNDLDYGLYSYTEDGDGVDLYVLDSGVRGASRPTSATGANLHPELFHPDHVADLNGATEQANYRVYEVPAYLSGYTINGEANSNEDDDGHGTYCACVAAGLQHGLAHKTRIYSLKVNQNNSGPLSLYVSALLAVINHNDPSHPNYKGSTRPAIINASLGVSSIPSEIYRFVPQNEPGFDSGPYEADTAMDDYENSCVDNGIVFVRSAGNGFGYNTAYGGYQAKFHPGPRTAGPQDYKYNMEGITDKISVGATGYINKFSTFSNYGSGVTTSAPGESMYVPRYYWSTNTPYNVPTSPYYGLIQGTSFSGPLTAGVVAQWLGKKGYQNRTTHEGKSVPKLAKEWLRRNIDWDYERTGGSTVGDEYGGGSVNTYPTDDIDEITFDGLNTYVSTGAQSNVITVTLGSEFARFNPVVGDKIQIRTPESIPATDIITDVWVSSVDSPTAAYYVAGGMVNLVTDNHPAPGAFGTFPSAGTAGYISQLQISQQGSGYTIVPTVSFSGGGGSNAAATAQITLTGGNITSINVDQSGSGYTEAPTVDIAGDGSGATATATIALTGGGVETVTVTNGGSGYNPLNLPAVTFTGGGGSNAEAQAVVTDGIVTAVNITASGSGYQSAPTVTIAIAAPPNQGANPLAPDGVFVSGGGSTTSASLNQTTNALTVVTDNLPQPALYGTFPNANNSYSITSQTYTHTYIYRGGRNISDTSPSNTTANDSVGIALNGVPLRHYSHGLNVDLPNGTGCPDGYTFNKIYNLTAFGADTGGGVVDSTGTYYYTNSNFLVNTWKGSTTTYTITVVSTAGGNKYFLNGTETPNIVLTEGNTYYFDQSDSTNNGYPFRISESQDGIHIQGGTEYLIGIRKQGTPGDGQAGTGTYIQVQPDAPNLFYYCSLYSGYGSAASVTTTANSSALPSATFDDINNATHHSPIIGFAYDGYPIYGPVGYDNPASPTALARMVSRWDLRSQRTGTQYSGSTYTWDVAADDNLDYDFTGHSSGSDIAIAANTGDNLVFNVDASYSTGGGGGGTPQTYNLVVTAGSNSAYTLSGSDRTGNVNGDNINLAINEGDTINFTVSASNHPFYIKTVSGAGTGNQVSGVTNQGTESGTVSWTPTSGDAGTYYYQCGNHGPMYGEIVVSSSGGGGATTVTHPFWIQKVPAPYNPAQVVSQVVNNGNHQATLLWNTTTASAGTYYYVCENHQEMTGTIVLTEPVGYAPSTTAYPLGSFVEDYEVNDDETNAAGETIHLDRRNGRFCVTPEFPGGTYAYFMTYNNANTPAFPYILGDTFYGEAVPEGTSAPQNPIFELPASAGCTIGTQIGVVDAITVTDPGVGYTYANITFSGGGGLGAEASANISVLDGYVSGLIIDNPGSGYSTAPTVNISAPNVGGGVQATAVATIAITAGNPNSIVDQAFNQNFNWRGGTNYKAITPTAKPLRSVNPFAITTTGVFLYHYSNEQGPTPGWTYNTVTNGNLVGEDAYGGYPNTSNVYGYNSSKLLGAYGNGGALGATYLTNTYFDLGFQTVNYTVTVGAKTAVHPYYNQGSANGYIIQGGAYTNATESPDLQLTRGNTYIFNQDDASNNTHPLYFSITEDGIHGGGTRYNDGVTYRLDGSAVDAIAYASGFDAATTRTVTFVVPQDAPATFYYVCANHPKMGNQTTQNSDVQGDYKRHADGHSKILGMSFDGYPIYGPYGYSSEMDKSSAVIRVKPAYQLKLPNRTPDNFSNRPVVGTYPYGSFIEDYEFQGNTTEDLEQTYLVSVSAAVNTGSGNRYYISGGGLTGTEEKPGFNFRKGIKYIFNQDDSSNDTHAMLFSTYGEATAQGWHVAGQTVGDPNAVFSGGVVYKLDGSTVDYGAYAAGFDAATSRQIEITPASDAPHTLYYFCYNHSNMAERIIIGDLDENNGRYCVTPDYPNGTFAYFITEDSNSAPAFPYIMGPNYHATPVMPGGIATEADSYVYDVGGIQFNVLQRQWWSITDVDSANNMFQFEPTAASFTATQSETGGNLLKVANLERTHQRADGVQRWMDLNPVGNKLYFQTEAQEDAGDGEGTTIVYLPADKGVDGGSVRGVVSPYIDLLTTWYTPAGALGTYNIGDAVNLQLGVSFLRTYANETILDRDYSLTGDISNTGLTFDKETGVLAGTLTNNTTLDLTLIVEENISGQTQTYTIQFTNTTTTAQDITMLYTGNSRAMDYNSVNKTLGQPNDDTQWDQNQWYSRPMSYKSFSITANQTAYENDKFEYVPYWQIYKDKGDGQGTVWWNLNEYAVGSGNQTFSGEEYDYFTDNVANRDHFYSYVENFEDVTGRELAICWLIANKWWQYDQDYFRCKLRFRLTFNLEASGNDYAVVVNQSGSTVYEVPKGAIYRFDTSDSSWSGKTLELRDGATGSPISAHVHSAGTPGSAGSYTEIVIGESYSASSIWFGQTGGSTFASQHLDFTTTYTAETSLVLQLAVSNLPTLPTQPILSVQSGATQITATTFSVNTEYGGLTHFPNTLPYISSNKSPKSGRYPVNLLCTDQNIEYLWYKKLYSYDVSNGTKSYNWDTVTNSYDDYVPLNSPKFRSRRDYSNNTTSYVSSYSADGKSVYNENYVSFTEEFPLRVNFGGSNIEIPVASPSQLLPPKDPSGNVIRTTDLPCNGIPKGINNPDSYQVVVSNGAANSSISNEISIIANPPELGVWWYEYANGWTGTVSNGYLRHDQGFVDTTLTCGDYFGNILVRSFVVDVGGSPLSSLPTIDINTLQVQDYYKGAQNFTVTNNQTQDVTVSYTVDAGQFTWKLRIINEFPYMETVNGGTRTVFTLNNATHANGPTVVNTGDFSTYTGQLATATGLLRECPFRGDTSINLPVDFSVKNDIQPAIFPARGTQKLYTLWVELVESPFSLTDLIHLTAVADPCHDQTYDFAYTQNGACITPSNDYFCNFVKPLKDRNHAEQPITGMEGVAQVQVTDGITPRVLDFQIPAPWPVLFSYLGDCNPTCA